MNILYYSPHPTLKLDDPTGYGTHMRKTIEAMEGEGHDVSAEIMGGRRRNGGGTRDDRSSPGVKDFLRTVVPSAAWRTLREVRLMYRDARFQRHLVKRIREIQPDLIYERGNYLQRSGVRAAEKTGTRHVLELNAPYVEEKKRLSGSRSLLERRARSAEEEQLRKTDRIVVISSALKNYLVDRHPVSPEKFTVVPNAIDPDAVRYDPDEVRRLEQQFAPGNRILLGYVGSLADWHNLDVLIRAVGDLRDEGKPVGGLIVGGGRNLPDLRQLARSRDLEDVVHFTGAVDHAAIYNYIAAMDIAVLPDTSWYMSPIKLFEYGVMGKPIVAPDQDPVREVLQHGTHALLVSPGRSNLCSAIRRLIDRPTLREKLGENVKRRIRDRHTWSRNVRKILESIQ